MWHFKNSRREKCFFFFSPDISGFAWARLALAGRKAIPRFLARFRNCGRLEHTPRSPAGTHICAVVFRRGPCVPAAKNARKDPPTEDKSFCIPQKKLISYNTKNITRQLIGILQKQHHQTRHDLAVYDHVMASGLAGKRSETFGSSLLSDTQRQQAAAVLVLKTRLQHQTAALPDARQQQFLLYEVLSGTSARGMRHLRTTESGCSSSRQLSIT